MIDIPSPAVAVVGRHNSGKTTLIERLIAELVGRGLDVGSIKHHSHRGFDIDIPGKDSYRHRAAGASETVIAAPGQVARIKTVEDEVECSELVRSMPNHDIIVVEGYRKSGLPTIEIMRSGNEADCRAARLFVKAAREGLPLTTDFTQLGRAVDRAPQLREVRRQRQALPGRLHEQASRTAVGLVARAHDLDGGQPAFAVALHHNDVVIRHRAHQLAALHLVFHGLDARHLPRGRNNRFGGAGGPVAVGVLAGNIDIEPAMGMVFDGTHVEPAAHQLGDEPLDERRFAGVVPPHDGHSRTWNIDHSCYALP